MKYKLRNNRALTKDASICVQEVLENRGIENVPDYLAPTVALENDARDLDNIDLAATTLLDLLQRDARILIAIDADADGFCSSGILWNYIKLIYPNANLSFYLHENKTHGLKDVVNTIDFNDYDAVICPDAGSYDIDCHQILHDNGIVVICLDHHSQEIDESGQEVIINPETAIVVNNQLSEHYKNKEFCGAGIVYKFCQVLDSMLNVDYASRFIDLAAIANIADMMNQSNLETRYIICQGLKHIENKGIQTILNAQEYSLKEKAKYPYIGITPLDIAFYVSPLMNAVTRVGTLEEKAMLFYALVSPDKELKSTKRGATQDEIETAAEQAARVCKNIKSRQDRQKEKAFQIIDSRIQKNCLADNNIIVVAIKPEDKIPQELTGILAQTIVSAYNKPAMVGRIGTDNVFRGSFRNSGSFQDLPELKAEFDKTGLFQFTAGHMNAGGQGIDVNNIDECIDYFNEHFNAESFDKTTVVDYVFDCNETCIASIGAEISKHQNCFGNGVDEVYVCIKNIPTRLAFFMGADKSSTKISHCGVDYVRFKDVDFVQIAADKQSMINVIGRFNTSVWNGNETTQVFIDSYEIAPKSKGKIDF